MTHVYVQTKEIEYNPEWISAIQLENMLMVFEMVVRASLLRKESRGAMYRRDYMKTDNKNWLKNIVIRQEENGKMGLKPKPDRRHKSSCSAKDHNPVLGNNVITMTQTIKIHVSRFNPKRDQGPHVETYEVPYVQGMSVYNAHRTY